MLRAGLQGSTYQLGEISPSDLASQRYKVTTHFEVNNPLIRGAKDGFSGHKRC